jgi:cellulose synthase/poly-beta-1,6-N-acetylglucosamine synthase-like glycosyltransferase
MEKVIHAMENIFHAMENEGRTSCRTLCAASGARVDADVMQERKQLMDKITVAICTGMGHDLTKLLESLVKTDCDEILIIGTQGYFFIFNSHFNDPRVRTMYAPHALNAKRNMALKEAKGNILAFVDDDAVVCTTWIQAIRDGFSSAKVGIVTGPSLLAPDSTLWQRTAQLAMASSPYSIRRYNPFEEGLVDWYNVIGANFAFRKTALADVGGCPEKFLAQGDDMAMAHNVASSGWLVHYSPRAAVHHPPHSFWRQVVQIHRFGRAAKRLKRAGIFHPKKDAAYYFYIPVLALFSFSYVFGEIKETLLRDTDIKARAVLGRYMKNCITKCLSVRAKPRDAQH